jgi:hypothetical protein
MRDILVISVMAAWVGAAAGACSPDQPDCTRGEADDCASARTICLNGIEADTDSETDEVEQAAACQDDYCACLNAAGCHADACAGTDN